MTKTSGDDLAGEIAYVRSMAEEGRNAPLVGGMLYVIWGAVIAFAALLSFFKVASAIKLPLIGGLWIWILALAIGWGASFVLGPRAGLKPGAMTIGNRTATAAWFAVGVYISLLWIAALAFRGRFAAIGVDPDFLFDLMFPVAFGLYGIAFYATAVAARLAWMRGFAVAAWIFSIAALYFVGDGRQLLIGAAGSVVCALLPGVLLMRREPREIV